jgi:cell surface protein SprA
MFNDDWAEGYVFLPSENIQPGSVKILLGNNMLVEGVDYTIDYNLGE